jgi:two-component system chemotaxis sensor kinase CheA
MARDPYKYFRVEAVELAEQLGQGVLDLEKRAEPELVARLLRWAHTLKGAARVVKQLEIAEQAHALEDVLAPHRDSAGTVPRERIDALLAIVDRIVEGIALLSPAPAAATPEARPVPDDALRTVRAEVAEVDALLEGVREAHAHLGVVRRNHGSLERARRLTDLLAGQLAARRGRDATLAEAHSLAEELQDLLARVERGVSSGAEQIDRELRQIRNATERLRLVAAGTLFTSLERAIRDVAQAQGKRVIFEGIGGDIRVDARVLETVQGALVQIVRNAVAHGIEAPDDRASRGKAPEGRVTLHVSRRGRRAVFACTDDGRGIDVEDVRRVARRKGILPAGNHELDVQELLRLLLRGGISTSRTVTEHSGRGVGLDVLREAAERVGGDVSVRTEKGVGTTIELLAPASIASVEALVVEGSGVIAAVPLNAVRWILRVGQGDVARTATGQSVLHEGKLLPFVELARLLGTKSALSSRTEGAFSAVVIEGTRGMAALGVDRLSGTTDVVVRALPDLTPSADFVAGASLDVDGDPLLLLDPDGVVAFAEDVGPPREKVTKQSRVLVVDDSLTTRMLEKSILESAGYEVHIATSGEEGLEKARLERYALFLVDVEMPGIDGFTFVERARADASLRDIPAILVTSRNAPEDFARSVEVGARAFIVKSEFDQQALLERIRNLLS